MKKMLAIRYIVFLTLLASGCAEHTNSSNSGAIAKNKSESSSLERTNREASLISTEINYLDGVEVQINAGMVRLSWFEEEARAYLNKNDRNFSIAARRIFPNVLIRPINSSGYVTVLYSGKFGDPYWEVTFDRSGKLSGHKSGIATEQTDYDPK
jgi:hypothetical protein